MSFKIKEAHWNILLEHMVAHPDLARGRLSTAQARKDYNSMWKELAHKLNSIGFGQKPVEKWQKSWSDYKLNLKKKASEINQSMNMTGGGPGNGKTLSDFEMKVLSILGDSFYKGVGVQEIIANKKPDRNVESEMMSFQVDPGRCLPASAINVTKEIEFEYQNNIENESECEESMSLSFVKPTTSKQPKLELPMMSTQPSTLLEWNKPKQIPFRKIQTYNNHTTKSPNKLNNDHDYLGNLPGPSNLGKRVSTRTNEEETKKIYEETVKVLQSIDNKVGRVADSLENLVGEIKSCCTFMKNVFENVERK